MPLCVLLLLLLLPRCQCVNPSASACMDLQSFYNTQGISPSPSPQGELSGEHPHICDQGSACCTRNMEEQLSYLSRKQLERRVQEARVSLQTSFHSQYKAYDSYMLELLNRSESSLLQSFQSAGVELYTNIGPSVRDLFTELRRYYRGHTTSLHDVLTEFWTRLLERWLWASYPAGVGDEGFLECAIQQVESCGPFGAALKELRASTVKAFAAAGAFGHGLQACGEVLRKVSKTPVSPECVQALMKLSYCPLCQGVPAAPPCSSYCHNVMKGCLANQADLDPEWSTLADAMLKVGERFRGPTGVEQFIQSLPSRLLEALVTLQENTEMFSSKVFQACGSTGESQTSRLGAEETGKLVKELGHYRTTPPTLGGQLQKLVWDVCRKLREVRRYWVQLPKALCYDRASAGDHCWNGVTQGRYLPAVMGDGLANQINNPEVEVDITKPDPTVRRQIMQLKISTNLLEKAIHASEVDFQDTREDASGSGSGVCTGNLCSHIDGRWETPSRSHIPETGSGRGLGSRPILSPALQLLSLASMLPLWR